MQRSENWAKLLLPFILTVSIGLFLRVINLTIIPVFADEAIYIRWSQLMQAVPTLRFIPLSDGKQPLFMWLTIPFLKLFSDPLFAGRFLSVIAGTTTIVGIATLTYLLFRNTRLAILSAVAAALSPFLFFFDRFALVDSLLTALGLWTFIFAVFLVQTKRLDVAMITGFLLGLSLITKSPAQIFLLLLPLTLVFSNLFPPQKLSLRSLIAPFLLVISTLIGIGIYNLLRLGPEFHMISLRNKDYVHPFSEIIKHPLNPLLPNLLTALSYYWYFLTPPIFLLVLLGLIRGNRKLSMQRLFLLSLFLLPLLAQSLIAKAPTARYLLFTVPYSLILASLGIAYILEKIKTKSTYYLILFLLLAWPISIILKLITDPQSLDLPRSERSGYFEMWTAGYGIQEASEYLKEQSKTSPILVGTEGYFGTLPNGLEIYLNQVPNITILGVGLHPDRVPQPLINSLVDHEVYWLLNQSRLGLVPVDNNLQLIASYPKATDPKGFRDHLLLFRVDESATIPTSN